jgi:glycosyltransferase involved in cell wall biosynthesis
MKRSNAKPLVSIVTPSFNQREFIDATIQSVLKQDYPNVEHIVMDGGSTDDTMKLLKQYEHLEWVSEPDKGQSDAINKGFKRSKGEIIAWLNSDDIYMPGAISEAVAALQQHPDWGIVYSNLIEIDSTGKSLRRFVTDEFDLEQEINRGNIIPQPASFFRRGVIEQAGWIDERYHYAMDYDLWIRAARIAPIKKVDGWWAGFRLHETSKTVSENQKFWAEERAISRKHGAPFFSPMYMHYLRTYHPRTYQVVGKGLAAARKLGLYHGDA